MTPSPEVSVVVGVRNGAELLRSALESVLSQDGVDFEIVVVDDGSSDGTRQTLQELALEDPRVRPIFQQPQGLTAALIQGCRQARAPFLARQDVGDLSLPGRLAAQLEVLRSESSVVLVSGRTDCYAPFGEWLWTEKGAAVEDRPVDLLERRGRLQVACGPTSHGSVMFRRETYEAVGGYRLPFYFGQDWDLWQRLGLRGKYFQVGRSIYARTLAFDSLSGQHRNLQHRFGRLSLKAARCLASGLSDEAVLRKAERLSRTLRLTRCTRPRGSGRAKTAYFVASVLAKHDTEAALRYVEQALSFSPWSLRPRILWWRLLFKG